VNEPDHRAGGRASRAADALGCTEGRVYTLAIGLALAVVLAVFGWPSARVELIAADPPEVGSALSPSAALPGAPSTSSPSATAGALSDAPAPSSTIGPSTPSSSMPEDARRDPRYLLSAELRQLEKAVANLVRDGCSRLSLVNVVVSLLPPEVRDPISLGPILGLLSQVYVACDQVAFPPTRLVCAFDLQVNAAILQSPLGLFLQTVPPVVGHGVELLTALTDTVFGALGAADPLLKPLLMEQLGCTEVEQ
jgi:hypothetical protein